MIRRLLLLGLLLAALPLAAQTTQIRIFELKHRPAEELIDIVGPLVDPEGTVTGSGYRLIVRSSLQNLAELEGVVARLDTPQRQFLVSVRQGAEQEVVRRGGEVSGTIEAGGGTLSTGRGGGPRLRVFSSGGERDDRITQRLRLLEGGWGRIAAGEAIPVAQQNVTTGPGGTSMQQSIEYRDVDTGFEVRPRLAGEGTVTVDVRPFRARPAPSGGGVIEQQSLQTRITGRLGEWLEIGGGIDTRTEGRRGTVYTTKERDRLTRRVFVRIELID